MWPFKKKAKDSFEERYPELNGVKTLLGEIIGSQEKPAKVENQKLIDGSVYTGEAILCSNGFYLPNGFGKKVISKEVEMTGQWVDGIANGVCYVNMHHSMVTGHFVNNRPNGWCISVEGGRGFVFGVFKTDDCIFSLGDTVLWMMRGVNMGLRTSSKLGLVIVGEIRNNTVCGFHFMNNGDVYVGTDGKTMNKTGFFFKFTHDGYIQIGRFEEGVLVEQLAPQAVVLANGLDASLLPTLIDINKKYF